ncbi:MAG TPA: bifunctional phosphoribosylaminoimidazolecarboxamide formyltransferase/IMP cyclohydrolase [Chloroflexota bacterium]|nr:bifunctional phosphoribosylaminoimidazolecarboxamide formyltransferase/IMP cyclohydrolase [Chloroflexota bacterium]
MRALVSVYDKAGVVDLCRQLVELGCELVSTGGTFAALTGAGLPALELAALTGFPEILDGRVKTLHPAVHAGLLARRDEPRHLAQLAEHGLTPFDLLVSNLYPFEATLGRPEATEEEIVEQIDVGGPAMLRAAAKNHAHVLVLIDPADYEPALAALRRGSVDAALRRRLAAKAFQHVASYDTLVASYLRGEDEEFPDLLTIGLRKVQPLRYGENPHQRAALYLETPSAGLEATLAGGRQLQGPELSFNNLLDMDAALACVRDFGAPTAAIVKHGNPCGLASAESTAEAFAGALATDPMSAFGGAIALNRPFDLATAAVMGGQVFHDLAAPAFDPAALDGLRKRRNLRVFEVPDAAGRVPGAGYPLAGGAGRGAAARARFRYDVKRVSGGYLVQTPDRLAEDALELRVVTERGPTPEELRDLRFAWRAVKHVRSNAIVLARERKLVGIGAGQMSRVDSVEIAVKKAAGRANGSVLASDGLIPFVDGAEAAAAAGVRAIVQPGGSLRDEEVVAVANRHDIAMVFTGARHFRH